jgi:excinuclease ABC subunit C
VEGAAGSLPPAPAAPAGKPPRKGREREGEWDLPDLFVVDGGRGQLQVALSAARDLGLHGLPIVGLAKERENALGDKVVERVYLPGQKNGIPLRQGARRSSSSRGPGTRRTGSPTSRGSGSASARGCAPTSTTSPGSARPEKTLLRELGSMAAVRAATDAQILAVKGITKRHLTALRKVIMVPDTG